MLDDLEQLDGVLDDISILKKRSKLLEILLGYYDYSTMTFNIPSKWKGRVRIDKLPAETPRHYILNRIQDNLSEDEYVQL